MLIRLNKLEYTSSMHEKKIRFTGWCTLLEQEQGVSITPILQNKKDSTSSNKFLDQTIANNIKNNLKYKVNLIKTNREISDYDQNLKGKMLLFEGEIETEYYDNELFIQAKTEQNTAFSNKLSIKFDKIRKTHAYFLSPQNSWVENDFFLVSFWVHRDTEGEEVTERDTEHHKLSAKLFIDDKEIGDFIEVKDAKHELVPIINKKSATILSRLVRASEIKSKKWVDIRAEIQFGSGQTHSISIDKFNLLPKSQKPAKLLNSQIDKDGNITLEANSFLGKISINNKEIKDKEVFDISTNDACFYNVKAKFKPSFGKNQIYLHEKNWLKAKPKSIQNYTNKLIYIHKSNFSKFKASLGYINSLVPKNLKKDNKNTENKKITLVSHNLSRYEGAPKVLYQVFSELKDNFSQIQVISPRDGELKKDWEALGAKVEICSGLEAQESLFNFNPKHIFANTIHSYWAINLANYLDIPCYWSIHESTDPYKAFFEVKDSNALINAFYSKAKFCFVAKATMDLYKEVFPEIDSIVIPNGIESKDSSTDSFTIKKELGISPNELMFLTVGTTTERKGQDIILEELSTLAKNKNHKYFFVGARENDFLDKLRKKITKLDLKDNVKLVKETKDVDKYYRAADVKLIASREESAPLVSLEALAYGLPIISTNVFGLAEQLEDNKTCLFFDHNKKGDLAKKIEKISSDEDLRKSLSKNAVKASKERFSKKRQIEEYKKFLINC